MTTKVTCKKCGIEALSKCVKKRNIHYASDEDANDPCDHDWTFDTICLFGCCSPQLEDWMVELIEQAYYELFYPLYGDKEFSSKIQYIANSEYKSILWDINAYLKESSHG